MTKMIGNSPFIYNDAGSNIVGARNPNGSMSGLIGTGPLASRPTAAEYGIGTWQNGATLYVSDGVNWSNASSNTPIESNSWLSVNLLFRIQFSGTGTVNISTKDASGTVLTNPPLTRYPASTAIKSVMRLVYIPTSIRLVEHIPVRILSITVVKALASLALFLTLIMPRQNPCLLQSGGYQRPQNQQHSHKPFLLSLGVLYWHGH